MLTFGEFISLVADMRQAQNDHRRSPTRTNLRRRYSLQHQVDTAIAAYRDAPPLPPYLDDEVTSC